MTTTSADKLHQAIDQLCDTRRIKVRRDGSTQPQWQTVPSLLTQLAAALGAQGGSGGSVIAKSRPTINVGAVSLLQTITRETIAVVTCLGGKPAEKLPDTVRRAGSMITSEKDPALTDEWAGRISQWSTEIRGVLRLDVSRPRELRGAKCPDCGAERHTTINDEGESVKQAALIASWANPDDSTWTSGDEYRDATVAANAELNGVTCQACKREWRRGGDMAELVKTMLAANQTQETMVG